MNVCLLVNLTLVVFKEKKKSNDHWGRSMDKLTTKTSSRTHPNLRSATYEVAIGIQDHEWFVHNYYMCIFNYSLKGNSPTGYASFAYDGMWAYALALDKLFKSDPFGLDTIKTNQTTQWVAKYYPGENLQWLRQFFLSLSFWVKHILLNLYRTNGLLCTSVFQHFLPQGASLGLSVFNADNPDTRFAF